MKIAFATHYDLLEKSTWPPHLIGHFGTSHHMAQALKSQCESLKYIGPLEKEYSLIAKIEFHIHRILKIKTYHSWAAPSINENYARQITKNISETKPDVIVCPHMNVIAYLRCKQPVVLWTDSLYAGTMNTFPDGNPCKTSVRHLKTLDRLALNHCKLVIFSSEWAAQLAIKTYKVDPSKVKVVPTGANVECDRSKDDIRNIINSRSAKVCKLFFCGVRWLRKGGDTALKVAKELNNSGLATELTIVGCEPITDEPLPHFVRSLGFVDRSTEEGQKLIESLFKESHFLILPSRVDFTPAVIREASSFGLPSLSTNIGGIPTLIRDGYNGKTFTLEADIAEYCNYVVDLFSRYSEYEKLAFSSFDEYQSRLNWTAAGKAVAQYLSDIV